jgi:ABC-type transporter Mla MlaB component
MSESGGVAGPIDEVVASNLPRLETADDDDLLAEAGMLSAADADLAGPISRDTLVALGRGLVGAHSKLRKAVCTNRGEISDSIDSANVTALVALTAPIFGFTAALVPTAVVALAVLLLKVGLTAYCQSHDAPPHLDS